MSKPVIYQVVIEVEVCTPLFHHRTDKMISLDIAPDFVELVGNADSSGAGLGYRDASGCSNLRTIEEANQWQKEVQASLQKLFPLDLYPDTPPIADWWLRFDDEDIEDGIGRVEGNLVEIEDPEDEVTVPLDQIEIAPEEPGFSLDNRLAQYLCDEVIEAYIENGELR